MDVGDALRTHVHDQLDGAVSKYFQRALDATVTLTRETQRFRADISVHPGRGLVVQGSASGDEVRGAFDGALARIEKQLRRYKRRIRDHHQRNRGSEELLPALQYVLTSAPEESEVAEDAQPAIITEIPTEIATLTVGEAVMRMDLADAPAMMFRNRANGVLNVIYHRPDGNIGWIDPSDTRQEEI